MNKSLLLFSLFSLSLLTGCSPKACEHSIIIDAAKAATCTENGLTEGSHCEKCGEVLVKQEIIAPLGHTSVVDEAVLPTCTETGLTEGSHCSVCGETLVAQTIVPAAGHVSAIDEAVAPSCTHTGLTEGSHCLVCGETLVAQEEVKCLEHDLVFESIVTGTVDGVSMPGAFRCSVCKNIIYKSLSYEDLGMPTLSLNGDFTGISKNNKVKLSCKYESKEQCFDCDATLKWQGSSSIGFPKKNYNIALYKSGTNYDKKNKVTLVESWGKQSKYTLKANWVDYSQLRNVVSGKLYGQVVHSRNIDDEFNNLVNGGAIDGFPILIYQNGTYQGLYTLNIPKDDWLFDMDGEEEDRVAMISTNTWNNAVALREHINDTWTNGYEVEYSSTDETETGNQWIVDSFNNMMDFVNNNSGEDFKKGISDYVNVDRVIDSLLFTSLIKACDNSSKNIIWATYDGIHWQPSVYDMDGVFGLVWDGTFYNTDVFFPTSGNALWEKVYANYKTEVIAEYQRLREGVMSVSNVMKEFTAFDSLIPSSIRDCEKVKWPTVPSIDSNNLNQIQTWYTEYTANFDKYISKL